MSDLTFLDGYTGQTLDELIALEASHRVDSLVLAMEAALEQRIERDGPGTIVPEERVILAVEALEREVNNGGYDQFFRNSSRQYAGEIESALEAIGCSQQAVISARAIKALGIMGRLTEDALERAVEDGGEALAENLQACDNDFYAATEDIVGQLFAFAKTNRSRIRLR